MAVRRDPASAHDAVVVEVEPGAADLLPAGSQVAVGVGVVPVVAHLLPGARGHGAVVVEVVPARPDLHQADGLGADFVGIEPCVAQVQPRAGGDDAGALGVETESVLVDPPVGLHDAVAVEVVLGIVDVLPARESSAVGVGVVPLAIQLQPRAGLQGAVGADVVLASSVGNPGVGLLDAVLVVVQLAVLLPPFLLGLSRRNRGLVRGSGIFRRRGARCLTR